VCSLQGLALTRWLVVHPVNVAGCLSSVAVLKHCCMAWVKSTYRVFYQGCTRGWHEVPYFIPLRHRGVLTLAVAVVLPNMQASMCDLRVSTSALCVKLSTRNLALCCLSCRSCNTN
jgi:hypothetical protein